MSSTLKSGKQVRAGYSLALTPAAGDRKSVLWLAGRLAQFANADEPPVEPLRDFFPTSFWNGSHEEPIHIDVEQGGSGGIQFVSVKDWETFQQTLHQAWDEHFPPDLSVWLISTLREPLSILTVWPAQRAIMFLAVESWRARFCGACGKRFVADKPARRFCSPVCTGNARKSSRRAWWNRSGTNWRAKTRRTRTKRRTTR